MGVRSARSRDCARAPGRGPGPGHGRVVVEPAEANAGRIETDAANTKRTEQAQKKTRKEGANGRWKTLNRASSRRAPLGTPA